MWTPDPHTLTFFATLAFAVVLSLVPYVRVPFQWLETYFHELSHGLAALLTFGRLHRLRVAWNGAGLATTYGGWPLLILLAGYAGAVGWGMLIYFAGVYLGQQASFHILAGLIGLMVVSVLLWVRDFVTFIILGILSLLFWVPLLVPDLPIYKHVLQMIGMKVTLNAVKAPFDLIDGRHVGDGAELANRTLLIPEGVWIALWVLMGLAGLGYMWQMPLPPDDRLLTFLPGLR
jgi:hypothetical protein